MYILVIIITKHMEQNKGTTVTDDTTMISVHAGAKA